MATFTLSCSQFANRKGNQVLTTLKSLDSGANQSTQPTETTPANVNIANLVIERKERLGG